jgi:NADH-quinone oxidoreductase subunit L
MYQAIVFLPLLGAILAALISLTSARARYPGGTSGAASHAHAAPPSRDPAHDSARTARRRRISSPLSPRASPS